MEKSIILLTSRILLVDMIQECYRLLISVLMLFTDIMSVLIVDILIKYSVVSIRQFLGDPQWV